MHSSLIETETVENGEVFERVRSLLSKAFKLDASLIQKDTNLTDDLGLDSLDLMDAICFAEAEFKIKIIEENEENILFPKTVDELLILISQKIQKLTK